MPIYHSKDEVKSGVPFGGIGAGKLEILPNGLFNAFTFQNNWSEPISGDSAYPGILGYHLGVSVESGKSKREFLLQTVPVGRIPILKNIRYRGLFPRAELFYDAPGTGLDLSLEIFSPWIPGDAKNSSLPAVFFRLKVKNRNKFPVRFAFLFIGRNTSGEWCVGRRNRVEESNGALHLEFSNEDPSRTDKKQGSLRFSFLKDGWKTSFMEYWNAVTQNFSFNAENISLKAWDFFAREGVLPDSRSEGPVSGENREACGAVSASSELRPEEEKTLSFTASWHFPHHPFGHRYARWFKDAAAVARYALPRAEDFRRGVLEVERRVSSLPFPDWFNEALLINLAPFFASTWHTKDGHAVFYEAPVICPLMGTVDVGFYGSIPLSYFFPELEKSQIALFADAQRKDGYIPHDLGKNRIDFPSDGTTFYKWKDLNPKFTLMLYRDYLWSGDAGFLKKHYPIAKKAMRWIFGTDHDGNFLPDNEGSDQTFDLWGFRGTNAYTSGIFLAALLASEKMAELAGDAGFARECRDRFRKGSESFEKELWNGRFFGETCSLSQLNGQWYADLLGLGFIVDRRKIQKALHSIFRLNARPSRFGMVNSVLSDGKLDISNNHAKNVWGGMNYAFADLCLTQGFPVKKVLKPIYQLWDNVARIRKNPWNQPDMVDSKTGQFLFGDSYYRNMAIWSIPIAYSLRDGKTRRILRSLKTLARK